MKTINKTELVFVVSAFQTKNKTELVFLATVSDVACNTNNKTEQQSYPSK